MQVAHLTTSTSTLGGGVAIAVQSLVIAQRGAGVLPIVVSHLDSGSSLDRWPEGSPIQVVAKRWAGMAWAPALTATIERSRPELLHLHGLWGQCSVVAHRFGRRHSLPVVIGPHGMLDPWALKNSGWKKRLAGRMFERRNLMGAQCLHALCKSEADAMRVYGLKNPTAIIPNGVGLPEIGERKSEIGNQKDSLLFLGRIHPKKGLENALKAWASLQKTANRQGPAVNWIFIIAGWGQNGHEADLKRLCEELGLVFAETSAAEYVGRSATVLDAPLQSEASVVFVGPAFGEAKDRLLRKAKAFILPSFSEGLPMAVLEAWSYRLPVLMTDHCNLPEGFGADAAIRIGTDVESIAKGLTEILESTVRDLQSLGANGRALVERQFTWPQVAAQMKEIYEWVLGGGSKPGCVE